MTAFAENRYISLEGSPYQVGRQLGECLQESLANDITHYLNAGPLQAGEITSKQLSAGALDWAHSLPQRFLDEMEGLADGAGIPLQRVAEWGYADSGGKQAAVLFSSEPVMASGSGETMTSGYLMFGAMPSSAR